MVDIMGFVDLLREREARFGTRVESRVETEVG